MNLMTPRILWAALVMSTGIYVVIPNFMQRPEELPQRMMLIIFAMLAVSVGVASFILPRHIFRMALERLRLEVVEDQDRSEERGFRDKPSAQRRFADPAQVRKRLMTIWFTPFILSLAMAEAIAIFGLVLLFLGASYIEGIPYFVACWVLFAIRVPREATIIAAAEKVYQAKLVDAG